jgi:hypothetical protein
MSGKNLNTRSQSPSITCKWPAGSNQLRLSLKVLALDVEITLYFRQMTAFRIGNPYPCLEPIVNVSGELGGDISTCSPYLLAVELCRGSLVCRGFGERRS